MIVMLTLIVVTVMGALHVPVKWNSLEMAHFVLVRS